MIVAGFDEAGYGPKLGPLTVGFTAFEVTPPHAPGAKVKAEPELSPLGDAPCLWKKLGSSVRRERAGDPNRVWVADSKEIKPQKDGIRQLELGVLAFLASAGLHPRTLGDLVATLGQTDFAWGGLPWYGALQEAGVPGQAWAGEVATRAARLTEAGKTGGVRFVCAGARVVDEERFNARIEATQNKAAVLGELFIDLVKQLRNGTEGPLDVVVDRHGGRATYTRMLGKAFPRTAIEIDLEEAEVSRYRVKHKRGLIRLTFKVEAETTSLPTALASMTCKYLRERFMDGLNAWFQGHMPGLKGTAGYAQDATRFLAEVEPLLPGLGVARDVLVRAR